MKVDKYYDLSCGYCKGRLSEGYGQDRFLTRHDALNAAKRIGWHTHKKKNICPECYEDLIIIPRDARRFKKGAEE